MVEWKYCYKPKDLKKAARGCRINVSCSYKHAVMVARALKGMKLEDAYAYLEEVILKKRFIPFVKFNASRGHKPKINGIGGPGGYPIKACKEFLKLLKNAEKNAEKNINLNVKNLKISHICALKGRKITKLKPKGRWAIWRRTYVHLQVVLEEDTENITTEKSNKTEATAKIQKAQ